jgi:hypothetical protein
MQNEVPGESQTKTIYERKRSDNKLKQKKTGGSGLFLIRQQVIVAIERNTS